ncbi:NrfD/PsrC family molybdoenzyme membrane anchor subunit [Melioribacteraceae bacterium 4301-Me]|uniref:NrfD/PsrC family molybdoenzyme membrane anchor subunit n=1 Tax=Pyranulibacter aquaticus TaxID=3163344 RepID=UPI0035962E9A
MFELSTTRNNPLIDPALHAWGWEIPIYLFLGGLVAGMMIISGYFIFSGRQKNPDCACNFLPFFSIFFLTIGMLSLFFDLENKINVWRLYTTFQLTSPMSYGAWILILVYPALVLNIFIRPPQLLINKIPKLKIISDKLYERSYLIKWIGVLNMIWGFLLGAYTGVLLSTMSARPLWNSSLLWMLFIVSGLSSAAAFVHMIARDRYERELLAKADNGFLTTEIFVIALLLIGLLTSSQSGINAAKLLLTGPFASTFWVLVVGIGILIPLPLQLLAVNHKVKHTPIPPLMVIMGGLILRFVIVYAGQYSNWLNIHF